MSGWQQIGRRVLLDRPPFLRVEEHTVRAPNGEVIPDWTWVETPDYTNIAAATPDGRFVCLREARYGVEGASLAAPGGLVESGESPLDAARRELLEETGYTAPEWTPLGSYRVDCNRGVGTAHFFLARRAGRTAEPARADLERPQVLLLDRAEMETAIARGEFRSLSWAACWALAMLALRDGAD